MHGGRLEGRDSFLFRSTASRRTARPPHENALPAADQTGEQVGRRDGQRLRAEAHQDEAPPGSAARASGAAPSGKTRHVREDGARLDLAVQLVRNIADLHRRHLVTAYRHADSNGTCDPHVREPAGQASVLPVVRAEATRVRHGTSGARVVHEDVEPAVRERETGRHDCGRAGDERNASAQIAHVRRSRGRARDRRGRGHRSRARRSSRGRRAGCRPRGRASSAGAGSRSRTSPRLRR